MAEPQGSGLTGLGKLISFALIAALLGVGVFVVMKKGVKSPIQSASKADDGSTSSGKSADAGSGDAGAAPVASMQAQVPRLTPPTAYQPKDNIIEVELSEYAGYAGL